MKIIVFGLDRLPRLHPQVLTHLPHVPCGDGPLRLNSVPISAPFFPAGGGLDHEARMAWTRKWLISFCGDYNPVAVAFIEAYLDRASAYVVDHSDKIWHALSRFDGLYRPEDYLWSLLRPFGRAWLVERETVLARADVGFWDGRRFQGLAREGIPSDTEDFAILPLTLATAYQMADRLLDLSTAKGLFAAGSEAHLPRSPFRRMIATPHFAAASGASVQ